MLVIRILEVRILNPINENVDTIKYHIVKLYFTCAEVRLFEMLHTLQLYLKIKAIVVLEFLYNNQIIVRIVSFIFFSVIIQ